MQSREQQFEAILYNLKLARVINTSEYNIIRTYVKPSYEVNVILNDVLHGKIDIKDVIYSLQRIN